MRTFKALTLLSLVLCTCVSCTAKETAQPASDSDSEAAIQSVADIIANTDKYKEQIFNAAYDNIKINENFVLNTVSEDTVAIYEAAYVTDFIDSSDTLFEKYVTDYDKANVKTEYEDDPYTCLLYENDDDFSWITSIGGFAIAEREYVNTVINGTEIDYIETDVVGYDSPDKEITIGNAKATLGELTDNTNEFLEDFCQTASYSTQIKPFTFSTQQLEDGRIVGTMRCRHYYKGIPILDLHDLYNDEYGKEEADVTPPGFTFIEGGNMSDFYVTHDLTDYKTLQKIDEMITPYEAMNLVSKRLSGYMSLEAKMEELVFFPENGENINTHEVTNSANINPGDTLKLTPYWAVYFDLSWWQEVFAIVDVTTGEVTFVRNVG